MDCHEGPDFGSAAEEAVLIATFKCRLSQGHFAKSLSLCARSSTGYSVGLRSQRLWVQIPRGVPITSHISDRQRFHATHASEDDCFRPERIDREHNLYFT